MKNFVVILLVSHKKIILKVSVGSIICLSEGLDYPLQEHDFVEMHYN